MSRLVGTLGSRGVGTDGPPGDAGKPPALAGTGGSSFPVAGPVRFADDWGAPRRTTGRHQGVDIFAPAGTPVVAVNAGVVTKKGPSKIGGNRLWLNGSLYYAHLSGFAPGIEVGTKVDRGQVLGYVGNTGDALGTSPHLHFGWDPSGGQGARWANPYSMLKSLGAQ